AWCIRLVPTPRPRVPARPRAAPARAHLPLEGLAVNGAPLVVVPSLCTWPARRSAPGPCAVLAAPANPTAGPPAQRMTAGADIGLSPPVRPHHAHHRRPGAAPLPEAPPADQPVLAGAARAPPTPVAGARR